MASKYRGADGPVPQIEYTEKEVSATLLCVSCRFLSLCEFALEEFWGFSRSLLILFTQSQVVLGCDLGLRLGRAY